MRRNPAPGIAGSGVSVRNWIVDSTGMGYFSVFLIPDLCVVGIDLHSWCVYVVSRRGCLQCHCCSKEFPESIMVLCLCCGKKDWGVESLKEVGVGVGG